MVEQPLGTVTLVFTDIEGSTRLLQELGQEGYRVALARHRDVVRDAFGRRGGYEVDYEGDSFFYAFSSAGGAVQAVSEAMAGLQRGPIRIRVGVHTGEPGLDPPKYVGMDVHRAARIMAAAHGGQVLVSEVTRRELDESMPLRDLGEQRLKDLGAPIRLYQLGEGEFPSLKVLYRSTLPLQLDALVGRARELEEAGTLLREHRLVTLTGAGGSGKTRLALQLAADAAETFPDGVYWVSLQALRDPRLVLPSIGQALEAKGDVAEHIADRRTLLLLDNLEQVIDAAEDLADLLEKTPNLKLLATSREPLNVAGEREYAVDSLPLDDAVALFAERAGRVDSRETVEAICHRVDCLPLAIELVAARTKLVPPEQLLGRLEQALALLTGGRRDAPARQRTLRATIQWSYELLDDNGQRLFRRLSVFAGSFDLQAAEEVVEANFDDLQSLLEKNLIRRWESGRFGLLETVREYAGECLTASLEAEQITRRHADWYGALASAAEPELTGPDQIAWLTRLEAEHPNLRVALRTLSETDPVAGLTLASSLTRFLYSHAHIEEGRATLRDALERAPHADPLARARGTAALGIFSVLLDDYESAQQLFEEVLAVCEGQDAPGLLVDALNGLGNVAWARGDLSQARDLYQSALESVRATTESGFTNEGDVLGNLGSCLVSLGDVAGGSALLEHSLVWRQERGEIYGVAFSLDTLAELAFIEGDYERAGSLSQQAAAMFQELGDPLGANNLVRVACVAIARGEPAGPLLTQALEELRPTRNVPSLAAALDATGAALTVDEAHEQAATLWGAASAARTAIGGRWAGAERSLVEPHLPDVRNALGNDRFEKAWSSGLNMTLDEAVAYALTALGPPAATP